MIKICRVRVVYFQMNVDLETVPEKPNAVGLAEKATTPGSRARASRPSATINNLNFCLAMLETALFLVLGLSCQALRVAMGIKYLIA